MNDQTNPPGDLLAVIDPVVFTKDGAVFANSRDVATYFAKRHDHVLRDIDALIAKDPSLGGLPNFGDTPCFQKSSYIEPTTGQTYRCFDMDQMGFTLLAVGFTGTKALQFKIRYVRAFAAMEKELRRIAESGPAFNLNDPAQLRGLLLNYAEKTEHLERRVQELLPSQAALDRLAHADGSLCITDAAKALQMRPKDLFDWLRQNGWIYKRAGAASDLGYQSKTVAGLLEHKVTTVLRADGSEKVTEQVRITARGLTKLAKMVNISQPVLVL
jgi:Rha family phage regulatory protein